MVFYVVVGVLLVVVLGFAWRSDHRSTGRKGWIKPPIDDEGVGDAKSRRFIRDMGRGGDIIGP